MDQLYRLYVGHFAKDWIGLSATEKLSYIRYGEFHRIENGQALESYIYIDIPELMIASNQWPLDMGPGNSRGYTGLIQGPASRDGVLTQASDPIEGHLSYQIVTNMLNKLCLLYTSPSPRDAHESRMPSSA